MERPSEPLAAPFKPGRAGRLAQAALLYLALGGLLAYALRGVPLDSIRRALSALSLAQIGALLALNAAVILLMALRWWLVARAEAPGLPFLPLVGARLAVFGISYFTPGPQVGGEPLQILALQRGQGMSFARAAATLILDKLLELLGNFLFIGFGLLAFLRLGRLAEIPLWAWLPLALLLLWPALHLLLLRGGMRPLSLLLGAARPSRRRHRWMRLLAVSESLAGSFTRRHPFHLLGALAASLLCWSGMTLEYMLILNFLGLHPDLWQGLFGLTASLLAFLLPLPGGLGALEASQVAALGSLGYPAALALSVTLVMRARDLLNGGLGLLIAPRWLRR